MLFYHIDRTKLLEPNQMLDYENLPEKCNPEIVEYSQNRFQNKISRMGKIYLAYATLDNPEYPTFTAEIILELYRQHYFPNLPSRYQSICASDSIEQAHFWAKELHVDDYNIITFKSEKYLKADAAWRDLIKGNLSLSTVDTWSNNYWTGEIFYKKTRIEYLLPLPIKVEDVIYPPFK